MFGALFFWVYALARRIELPKGRALLGVLLTVAGIVVVVGGAAGVDLSIPHVLAIIGGAACFAEANVIAKIFPRNHPVATNAVAVPVGAAILAIVSLLSGEPFVIPKLATTWMAFSYIVIFVTVIAFLLYLFIISAGQLPVQPTPLYLSPW